MAYSDSPYDPPQRPARALRLIFSYKGSRTKLESKHSIEMIALPSDTTEEYKDRSGFWVELRDKEERVVYRKIMRNPIQVELEAPSGDPSRPFTRIENPNPEGTFSVLVPDVETAEALVLYASPAGATARAAREVTRVLLKEGRQVSSSASDEEPPASAQKGPAESGKTPRGGKPGGRKGKK